MGLCGSTLRETEDWGKKDAGRRARAGYLEKERGVDKWAMRERHGSASGEDGVQMPHRPRERARKEEQRTEAVVTDSSTCTQSGGSGEGSVGSAWSALRLLGTAGDMSGLCSAWATPDLLRKDTAGRRRETHSTESERNEEPSGSSWMLWRRIQGRPLLRTRERNAGAPGGCQAQRAMWPASLETDGVRDSGPTPNTPPIVRRLQF
eukprot:ctg_1456.g503